MYPDCDWLISQKLQSYSSRGGGGGGGGGRNSAENANYAENCKNSVNFEVRKICQISISFVSIATLYQQQITLNNERIYFVRQLTVIDKSQTKILPFLKLSQETKQFSTLCSSRFAV